MSFFTMTTKINTYTKFSSIILLVFALFLTHSTRLSASEPQDLTTEVISAEHAATPEHLENPPVDIAAVAFEHILDSHSWHFWGEHEHAVSLSLPIILKVNNGID